MLYTYIALDGLQPFNVELFWCFFWSFSVSYKLFPFSGHPPLVHIWPIMTNPPVRTKQPHAWSCMMDCGNSRSKNHHGFVEWGYLVWPGTRGLVMAGGKFSTSTSCRWTQWPIPDDQTEPPNFRHLGLELYYMYIYICIYVNNSLMYSTRDIFITHIQIFNIWFSMVESILYTYLYSYSLIFPYISHI